VARELEHAIGPARARAESATLLDELERALLALALPPAAYRDVCAGAESWASMERMLPPLLDSVPLPLLVLDREHRVRCWNSSFIHDLEIAEDGLRGRPLGDLLHPESRDWIERQLRADHARGSRSQFGQVKLAHRP